MIGRYILPNRPANKLIGIFIAKGEPAFITRFGSSELATLIYYMAERKGKQNPQPWPRHYQQILCDVSGFFPFTDDAMDRFSELYLSFLPNIDLLGVWKVGEEHMRHRLRKGVKFINLSAIEPYYFTKPWSGALEGKKVLVVHPFAKSIMKQYSKRQLLFHNKEVLPNFQLQVMESVQSVADNTQGFDNWFAALDFMINEIAKREFDVAVIGAGAYGMPLANFVKETMGKIAIHLGGATQILFGIKGKRWENIPAVRDMINENWISPSSAERPAGLEKVEGGCYW